MGLTSGSAIRKNVFSSLAYMAEAMKYALIVVSSAPLLIAYPFVQKYFVAGMMVGAVKG